MALLFLFIAPFLLSATLVYLWQDTLRKRQIFDHPNHRSSHIHPTPRSGGVGIFLAFWVGMFALVCIPEAFDFNTNLGSISIRQIRMDFFSIVWLFVASFLLFVVGLVDDFSPTQRRTRLVVQVSATGIFLGTLYPQLKEFIFYQISKISAIDSFDNYTIFNLLNTSHFITGIPILEFVLLGIFLLVLLLGIVWVINLTNFMDGLNGIATLEIVFIIVSLAYFSFHSGEIQETPETSLLIPSILIMVSSCLGFFIWNFPLAKVFLGDSGSNFLGFMVAVFGMWAILLGHISIWSCMILSLLFWMDATLTLFRRWKLGEKITEAHRSHLYQILNRRWNSHVKVVNLYLAINLFVIFPLAFLSEEFPEIGIYLLLLASISYSYIYFHNQKSVINHGT